MIESIKRVTKLWESLIHSEIEKDQTVTRTEGIHGDALHHGQESVQTQRPEDQFQAAIFESNQAIGVGFFPLPDPDIMRQINAQRGSSSPPPSSSPEDTKPLSPNEPDNPTL